MDFLKVSDALRTILQSPGVFFRRRHDGKNVAGSSYYVETDAICCPLSDGNYRRGRSATPLPHSFVDADVVFGRTVPGKIFRHSIAHENLPRSLVAEGP